MTYFRPTNLSDALDWLAAHDGCIAAGCTDLFPATDRPVLAGPVLDITAIDGLRGITRTDAGWRIGATTTWTDLIRAALPPAFDGLKLAAREVGSVQIQNAGTIAGNICNASPAADGVPCLLSLNTTVELASARGTRVLGLDEFITGPGETARGDGELVSALHVPADSGVGVSSFLKLGARKYLVISIAMVAARLIIQNGVIVQAALSAGSCSAVAVRLTKAEAALGGQPVEDALSRLTDPMIGEALSPIDDIRADAAYRAGAAAELIRRCVAQLLFDAAKVAA